MGARKDKHYRVIRDIIYARFVYTDSQGKRRERHLRADSRQHAQQLYEQMAREYRERGASVIDASTMTFAWLAKRYEEDRLQPAVYVGNTKVSGVRTWKDFCGHLKVLVAHFGQQRVQAISYQDLVTYRAKRFAIPTRRGKVRSVSHVNKELSLLRSIFNYAKRADWLIRSPFERGPSLISIADETRRDRLLSTDEENRLLAQCVERRAHLRPIIICAIDTGLRKGEILQLTWGDVDFDAGVLTIRSTTTKTRRARVVGMTGRLRTELLRLWTQPGVSLDQLVFGITDNVKKSFTGACKDAGICDLHFHDLRHVAITRMIQAGMPATEVMKISGHSQFSTFARYVNVVGDGARRAAQKLDEYMAAIEADRLKDEGISGGGETIH